MSLNMLLRVAVVVPCLAAAAATHAAWRSCGACLNRQLWRETQHATAALENAVVLGKGLVVEWKPRERHRRAKVGPCMYASERAG